MEQGVLHQDISDHTKALEINPNLVEAYINRAVDYYQAKEYDKAWIDVHKVKALGSVVHPGFIDALKKSSGGDK